MFLAQRDCLKDNFDLSEDDIDMPAFALFSIWSLAMGCTIVIPDMDQTRPALVNPERIIEAIKQNDVTFSFGSPALWNTVSRYCAAHHISLPSLEKVIMAGAPIPFFLHERMLGKILKDGADIFTPYGATECLPVSNFQGSKVLAETAEKTAAGQGYCVGQALPGNEVKVIAIDDGVISDFKDIKELPQGEIGEIIVKSDIVSRSYYELPEQTALHKIYEGDKATDPFWHRIGDLAYLDDQGRIWMCGRKSHRVVNGDKCWYTVCCEAICNNHPSVYRSALVGIGKDRYKQTPVMLLEAEEGDSIPLDEVKKLAAESDLTKDIKHFLVHPSFPVDIRHNAKIFREKLAPWAEERLDL